MNFDKFKDIDMPDVQVNPDFEYVNKLNKLPKEPQKSKVLSIIGTIAAAVVIVAAVSVWALIGRGIRGTDKPTVSPPANYNNEKKEVILTDITEWYDQAHQQNLTDDLNGNKPEPPLDAVPQTKEFEFLGKKYNLNLKDSWYQQSTFALYKYTDGNGTAFVFTKNGELVEYEYSNTSPKKDSVSSNSVTKDEAVQIAKDFAEQMFGEQIDDYTFDSVTEIGPSGPTEEYIVLFSKKYGSDDYLTGESCMVELKINGEIMQCGIRSLYEFKKLDLSVFESVSFADIKKAVFTLLSNSENYTYTIEFATISVYSNKTILNVGILHTYKDGGSAGFSRCFEVSAK